MRWFFWAPKTISYIDEENIHQITLKISIYPQCGSGDVVSADRGALIFVFFFIEATCTNEYGSSKAATLCQKTGQAIW